MQAKVQSMVSIEGITMNPWFPPMVSTKTAMVSAETVGGEVEIFNRPLFFRRHLRRALSLLAEGA